MVLVISNAPATLAFPVDQMMAVSASFTTERMTISPEANPEPQTLNSISFSVHRLLVTIVAPSVLVRASWVATDAWRPAMALPDPRAMTRRRVTSRIPLIDNNLFTLDEPPFLSNSYLKYLSSLLVESLHLTVRCWQICLIIGIK
jgi:hypothetical protein